MIRFLFFIFSLVFFGQFPVVQVGFQKELFQSATRFAGSFV